MSYMQFKLYSSTYVLTDNPSLSAYRHDCLQLVFDILMWFSMMVLMNFLQLIINFLLRFSLMAFITFLHACSNLLGNETQDMFISLCVVQCVV